MYKIESGFDRPKKYANRLGTSAFVGLDESMNVTDSIPVQTKKEAKACVAYFKKRNTVKKFSMQKCGDHYRIFRDE